jgi:hypothetical protein
MQSSTGQLLPAINADDCSESTDLLAFAVPDTYSWPTHVRLKS